MTDATLLAPDICVIGAGSGGLSVAAGAAAFGVPVVLVERGAMGGECLNTGCVPSKALLAAAHLAAEAREGAKLGIRLGPPETDWANVRRHIRETIESIAPHDSVERFTGLGVRVVQEHGRFLDPRTLQAGPIRIRARRFVIATGSRPRIPAIPGLAETPFLSNETLWECSDPIRHLIVLGAGAVGLELAQAHRRLGCDVTLIARGTALSREDPDMVAPVLRRIEGEGVRTLLHTKVLRAEPAPAGVRLLVEGPDGRETLEGSHLLLATGREACTDGLGLEAAGVAVGSDGIVTSAACRTANRRVYAIGDVAAGAPRFTHAAGEEAGLVLRATLFRLPVRKDERRIPRTLYTAPELARIGLTEAEARTKGHAVSVLRAPFAQNDRARAEGDTEGEIKLLAGPRGRLLGVSIVGRGAGESIHFWCLALAKNLGLRDVTHYVAPYPTRGEAGKRAAFSYFAGAAGNIWLRRLLRLLRAWG